MRHAYISVARLSDADSPTAAINQPLNQWSSCSRKPIRYAREYAQRIEAVIQTDRLWSAGRIGSSIADDVSELCYLRIMLLQRQEF